MNSLRHTLVLCASVLAACGTASAPPPAAPPAQVASSDPAKAAEPAPKQSPVESAPKKPVAESPPKASAKTSPPTPASVAKTAPAPAPAPKAAPKPAAKAPAPPASVAQAAKHAPLDLKALEERLKDTSAIGVLTKLSLKNQVDDLVARFRAYHGGSRPPTLPDLRPAFELLLMKVLSLLQDKDAGLAKDIDASRESIWSVLSDRDKFAQYTA